MFLNFRAAIAALGQNAAARIANAARPAADYLFNTLLPERNVFSYHIESGSITVRATMAGLASMDSPYPPGGMVELSTFMERTAKLANEVALSEQTIRAMQEMLMRLALSQAPTVDVVQRQLLNFLDKIILQPHMDAMEWLRGQALLGQINWTFGDRNLVVDYGIPAANILPARTGANGYGGSTSKFWDDVRALRRALRHNMRAIIAHPDTVDMIRYNPVNQLIATSESGGSITFRKFDTATNSFSLDSNDTVTIVIYGLEGEILNPADPNSTLIIPFMEKGKLLAIGNNSRTSQFVIGEGSTEDPDLASSLGYTHIAPTIENGGRPGRWSELYTPEQSPWSLHGRAVTNGLPVIEAADKIAIATTDMV